MSHVPAKLGPQSRAILELIAQGHTYEQILTIYPAATYLDIFSAARDALVLLTDGSKEPNEQLAELRKTHPRAYEKWTDEEDAQLAHLFRLGKSQRDIALTLQRQPGAIRSRLIKLRLLEPNTISLTGAPGSDLNRMSIITE